MDVILVKDLKGIGKAGQTVAVKEGYARNCLFPQGLAVPAVGGFKSQVQSQQAAQLRKAQVLKQKAQETADSLSQVACTIPVAVGQQGKLFGSVTSSDIVKALEAQGVALDRHQILLDDPINQIGTHSVSVKLHPEITATIQVSVVEKL